MASVEDSAADLPRNRKDRKLSLKHLRESIRFNRKHAKDHTKAMTAALKRMATISRM